LPKVVNPLSVSVNSTGKERLILDLRHVNKYLTLTKFKYEGVKEEKAYASNKKYCYKFDLTKARVSSHKNMHLSSPKKKSKSKKQNKQKRFAILSH
jgi:hypothetical protein